MHLVTGFRLFCPSSNALEKNVTAHGYIILLKTHSVQNIRNFENHNSTRIKPFFRIPFSQDQDIPHLKTTIVVADFERLPAVQDRFEIIRPCFQLVDLMIHGVCLLLPAGHFTTRPNL